MHADNRIFRKQFPLGIKPTFLTSSLYKLSPSIKIPARFQPRKEKKSENRCPTKIYLNFIKAGNNSSKLYCLQHESVLLPFKLFELILNPFLAPKHRRKIMSYPNSQNAIVVSMTGFVSDSREEQYKQAITDLGWRLAPTLSQETIVLIVNDVSTQKYKIAKTHNPPITCVSVEWLVKCHKSHKLLLATPYHLKDLFYGVSVKLLGFTKEKAIILQKKLSQNGAQVTIFHNNQSLEELSSEGDKTSVIVTSRHNFAKLKHHADQISYPVVDLDWIEDSFQAKMCKYPFDYAMNQIKINPKEPIEHYPKMKKRLEQRMKAPPLDKFQAKTFENCFIYLNANVNHELVPLLKKLVMVCGGFYLEELSPIVTHILTQPLFEQEYSQLRLFGSLVHVVRVEWLMDSIYIFKRMKQEDYQIRSFKDLKEGSKPANVHLEEKQNNFLASNSMSYYSYGVNTLNINNNQNSIPTILNNRKSISGFQQPALQSFKLKSGTKELKINKVIQTSIFKGQKFYIESTQKKEVELSDLAVKITKNSGEVFTSRADIKHGHCFYIIKDTTESKNLIEKLKEHTRGRVQIQPASHRWVTECLSKGHFIDILKSESYIFKPFNFKIPMHGIHKMVFQVLSLDDTLKLRLKQLYNNLGSTRNMVNKKEITHCLCGPNYQDLPRYQQLRRQNKSIKYLNWKWLLQCVNKGKLIEVESYLMEKEGPELQEIENTNTANIVKSC